MDRELIEAYRFTKRHVDTASHAAFFRGYTSALQVVLESYDKGRVDDDWINDLRQHLLRVRKYGD
jgi:hypothetical protein